MADTVVEKGANRLQRLAARAAASRGMTAKVAPTLAKDAAFLRKLKPRVATRARGKAPGGPNPFLVLGVAFALGIALAKIVDWRGHAHPRG